MSRLGLGDDGVWMKPCVAFFQSFETIQDNGSVNSFLPAQCVKGCQLPFGWRPTEKQDNETPSPPINQLPDNTWKWNEKGISYSNHPFSGVNSLLVSGRVSGYSVITLVQFFSVSAETGNVSFSYASRPDEPVLRGSENGWFSRMVNPHVARCKLLKLHKTHRQTDTSQGTNSIRRITWIKSSLS